MRILNLLSSSHIQKRFGFTSGIEMERKGATNLQLNLMVKAQEKKGSRKHDGKIVKMYEDGTVTVALVGGKVLSVDQSLISVPKGAVAALKAGK